METATTLQHHWPDEASSSTLIAIRKSVRDRAPGLIWLGGFKSDMLGTKAEAMVALAEQLGVSSLRFDYSGHGESGGEFTQGTISRWVAESVAVILEQTFGPQILVGSSMGGWIALRLVQELQKRGEKDRIAGLFLIAPAPDFTSELMEPAFSDEQREEMAQNGYVAEPTPYSDEPNIITRQLIEDGRNNLIFGSGLNVGKPVHILQGAADPDVPADHAHRIVAELVHDNVALTMVPDGDHRLSRDEDIALLNRLLHQFVTRYTNEEL
ncbi:alpha/beta hydrolase [Pseudahrensia aquimaris]|uniref:Palmitoyl-protein thioesterase ABHD10, mitochondrial n=1 Tax=Pseudahrensia aquimaris TaxID=744461 RepID=A0ABW3FE36_9HYPH